MNTPTKSLTRTQELEQKQKFFDESSLFDDLDPMIVNLIQDRFEKLMNPLLKNNGSDAKREAWIGKVIIVVGLLILFILLFAGAIIYAGNEVFSADFDEIWLFETIQVQQKMLGTSVEFSPSTVSTI